MNILTQINANHIPFFKDNKAVSSEENHYFQSLLNHLKQEIDYALTHNKPLSSVNVEYNMNIIDDIHQLHISEHSQSFEQKPYNLIIFELWQFMQLPHSFKIEWDVFLHYLDQKQVTLILHRDASMATLNITFEFKKTH